MKTRCVVFSVALMLLLLLTAAAQADAFLDFEGGISGFLQSGSCKLSQSTMAYAGAYSLGVEGRGQNDYDAADYPMESLGIRSGDRVDISFYAYHAGPEAGVIKAGLGGGSYAELARATVEPNTWTQITGTFTVAELANIRFQTYGANMNGVSFYVDDVKVSVQQAKVPAKDAFGGYAGGFEGGDTDGWYARSSGTAQAALSKDAAYSGISSLLIMGRSDNWNSPGRDFSLTAGNSYGLKCYVRQDSGADVEFILSAALTRGGQESYVNLIRKIAGSGEWVELAASYAAGDGIDRTVFYVETANAPKVDYWMDDFSVTGKSDSYRGDLPSLKEKYDKDFLMGCAVSRAQFDNPARIAFLSGQFNSFTPENEMKPENVFDAAKSRELAKTGDETHPAVKFDAAKPLLDYAKANGIAVHGHVLVWHSQTPRSFFTQGYAEDGPFASRETMLLRLENYIAAVMAYLDENYKGVVLSWDVVNEAVLDGSGALRGKKSQDDANGTYWMDTVGEDYIEMAFALARKYAPAGTQLYYNDYSVPYEPKLTGIKAVVSRLMDAGVVDGMGFQCHYQLTTPSAKQVGDAMAYFAGLGLQLRVSELDVTIPANTAESLLAQAKRYQSLMEVFLRFSDSMDAVTVWGTSDDLSWKGTQFPLLFDADMAPKPAFWAWADPAQLPIEKQAANGYGPAEPTDEYFNKATAYAFGGHVFRVLHDGEHVYVKVLVKDASNDETDSVTVLSGGAAQKAGRGEGVEADDGYGLTLSIPAAIAAGKPLEFDILVQDGEKYLAWNDRQNASASRQYGTLNLKELKECATAVYGKPDMSGAALDALWETAPSFLMTATPSQNADEDGQVKASFRALWQQDTLYVLVDVTDPHLDDSNASTYMQDSVEVFVDEGNHRAAAYEDDDGQYRVNFKNLLTVDHGTVTPVTRAFITEQGFAAEIAIPFTAAMTKGDVLGFDVRYNNATPDGQRTMLNFCDDSDTGWQDTGVFGLLELK